MAKMAEERALRQQMVAEGRIDDFRLAELPSLEHDGATTHGAGASVAPVGMIYDGSSHYSPEG